MRASEHALSSWTNSCSLRVATRCGQGDGLRILNQVSLEESGPVLNAPYGAWCFLTRKHLPLVLDVYPS